MNTTIGERIQMRRLELNMSQQELAEKTNYKKNVAISLIEQGKRDIPRKKIPIFAKALYTTSSWLLGLDEESDEIVGAEVVKYVEMLHKNPQFRVLLDSSSKLDEKSLRKLVDFVETLSEQD